MGTVIPTPAVGTAFRSVEDLPETRDTLKNAGLGSAMKS